MAHLNLSQKMQIYKAINSSSTNKIELAENIGTSRRNLYYVINKHWPTDRDGKPLEEKCKRIRSAKYTCQEEVNVLNFFDLFPFATYLDCIKYNNLSYCINTIRSILKKNGIYNYVSKRKPFLNLINQNKRQVDLISLKKAKILN